VDFFLHVQSAQRQFSSPSPQAARISLSHAHRTFVPSGSSVPWSLIDALLCVSGSCEKIGYSAKGRQTFKPLPYEVDEHEKKHG
jgi:hypothetical protein